MAWSEVGQDEVQTRVETPAADAAPAPAPKAASSPSAPAPRAWDRLRIVMWSLCGAAVLLGYWRLAVLVMYLQEENAHLHLKLDRAQVARVGAESARVTAQHEGLRQELKSEAEIKAMRRDLDKAYARVTEQRDAKLKAEGALAACKEQAAQIRTYERKKLQEARAALQQAQVEKERIQTALTVYTQQMRQKGEEYEKRLRARELELQAERRALQAELDKAQTARQQDRNAQDQAVAVLRAQVKALEEKNQMLTEELKSYKRRLGIR